MKNKLRILSIALTIIFLLNGCARTDTGANQTDIQTALPSQRTNSDNEENYPTRSAAGVAEKITPYDYLAGTTLSPESKKPYTIMIYMNGSDLESLYAAGTTDIQEMAHSRFDEANINIIIFTGGAREWHTRGIPNNANAIFKLNKGAISKLSDAGSASTGDPGVLSGFINFCHSMFPADKYGLIFWNHGGGAVIGYGSDERYEADPNAALMKLSEIDSALASTSLQEGFEFIGFDTCLMATLEMACIASKYANYLIASEELEPEQGWDYAFLREVKPDSDGAAVGRSIIDYFGRFYTNLELSDITTLSLTDLSQIGQLSYAFENFALSAGDALRIGNFNTISHARSRSRAFGSGSQGGETDMIDIYQLAEGLSGLLPLESQQLTEALNQSVIYKHESNVENLGGLSIYFPFTNKDDLDYYLQTYKAINELPNYTGFIDDFSAVLTGSPMQSYRGAVLKPEQSGGDAAAFTLTPEQLEGLSEIRLTTWKKKEDLDDGVQYYLQLGDSSEVEIKDDGSVAANLDETWTTVNGYWACLYETARDENRTRYAIPIELNGKEANLIAVYGKKYPNGRIIGAIPTSDDIYNTLDKKMVFLRNGDKIAMLYYAKTFAGDDEDANLHATEEWFKSEEFTVNGDLQLKKEAAASGEYLFKFNLIDTQYNDHYTDFAA